MDYKLVVDGDRKPLFGWKHHALTDIEQHSAAIWEACEYAYETLDNDHAADAIVYEISRAVKGFGPAKAGFVAQMVYGLSGCLDIHNLTRFGINARALPGLRQRPCKLDQYMERVRHYNQTCHKFGGTASLWDTWCEYVAERDSINYHNADHVSSLHLTPTLH